MDSAKKLDRHFKKVLEDQTETPSQYAWSILLNRLEQREHSNRYKVLYRKMMLFFIAMLLGLQFTSDREPGIGILNLEAMATNPDSNIGRTRARPLPKTVDAVFPKKGIVAVDKGTLHTGVKMARDTLRSKSRETETLAGIYNPLENGKNRIDLGSIDEVSQASPTVEVTDKEVEALIQQVRHHWKQEERKQLVQKMMAHQMLAEMEREMEAPTQKEFYDNVKQGFKKIKEIIAN